MLRNSLWREYLRQARSIAKREKERVAMIKAEMPAVERIARQVYPMFEAHVEFADLLQAGYLGLCEAALRYRESKARTGGFAAYAYFRIRGSMIDANKRRAYREASHARIEDLTLTNRIDGHENHRGSAWTKNNLTPICLTDPHPLQDAQLEEAERRRKLRDAIRALPEEERVVMIDHLSGKTIQITAAEQGRSALWARGRLQAAREMVAARIQGHSAA